MLDCLGHLNASFCVRFGHRFLRPTPLPAVNFLGAANKMLAFTTWVICFVCSCVNARAAIPAQFFHRCVPLPQQGFDGVGGLVAYFAATASVRAILLWGLVSMLHHAAKPHNQFLVVHGSPSFLPQKPGLQMRRPGWDRFLQVWSLVPVCGGIFQILIRARLRDHAAMFSIISALDPVPLPHPISIAVDHRVATAKRAWKQLDL